MSHSTVLIIGANPEEQLQPFDENLEVPEYLREDGEKSTYNPKSRWDWYQLGGRWTGFFRLKAGKSGVLGEPGLMTERAKPLSADSAAKGDIDFEAMEAEARDDATKQFDAWDQFLAGRELHKPWDEVRDVMFGEGKIDEARAFYHAQELVVSSRTPEARSILGEWANIDRFLVGREKFVASAVSSSFSTFAVLKDGEWYERGEMGWWGMVGNEKDRTAWDEEFKRLISDLPDDTPLAVYDVHI